MKIVKKPLIIFIILLIVGVIIRYIFGEKSQIWIFWGVLDTSSAVALALLAFLAYKDMLKDENEIELFFKVDNKEYPLNLKLLRKDCNRREIIGLLGMLQRKTDKRFRYNPAYLNLLLQELNKVQKGKGKKLLIPIDKKELNQFVLNNTIKKDN